MRDPVLAKVTNRLYRAFDLTYPDVDRAKIFIGELAEYEKSGNMPRLITMRLGNDHTSGTSAGKLRRSRAGGGQRLRAGNDREAVSKSRFWTSTVICVLEDDAQNGQDHVDSHRSPAFLISSYVKRRTVDSNMYNTASMLRTIEFLLGLRPMTQFDAGARAHVGVLPGDARPAPYTAEKPRIPLDTKNAPTAPAAAASNRMNFEEADQIDDDELNDILWRAIRKDQPPPPVRSYFGKRLATMDTMNE